MQKINPAINEWVDKQKIDETFKKLLKELILLESKNIYQQKYDYKTKFEIIFDNYSKKTFKNKGDK